MTAEKTSAERIAELEKQLQEKTAQLEAAHKELESFNYSVSHDLRAPLRSIDGFSKAAMEDAADKLGGAVLDHLQRVRASARQMNELIESLLNLSQLSRQSMQEEAVDLGALARDFMRSLQAHAPERRLELILHPGLAAKGDPALLRLVLENLLGNAWKFTGKTSGAKIEFGKSGREDGRTIFYVRDNGAGFDMKYAQKLFGAFQRMHRAEDFPGTGVGLATAQRIIHRHAGRIWAESAPGQGATFSFTLPNP